MVNSYKRNHFTLKKRFLLYVIVIFSACAQDNFKLVQGEKYSKKESTASTTEKRSTNEETSPAITKEESLRSEMQNAETLEEENAQLAEQQDAPIDRKLERLDRFEEKHLKDNPDAEQIVETVKKISGDAYEPMDPNIRLGITFLVLAAFVFLLYVLFYVKAEQTPVDGSSADGCIESLFDIAFYSIIAVIFGVGTLIFMILGFVFLGLGIGAVAKKKAAK